MANYNPKPGEAINYTPDGLNPFTSVAQAFWLANCEPWQQFNRLTVLEVAQHLKAGFVVGFKGAGLPNHGQQLLFLAVNNVNWIGLARVIFDELPLNAAAFEVERGETWERVNAKMMVYTLKNGFEFRGGYLWNGNKQAAVRFVIE